MENLLPPLLACMPNSIIVSPLIYYIIFFILLEEFTTASGHEITVFSLSFSVFIITMILAFRM